MHFQFDSSAVIFKYLKYKVFLKNFFLEF